MNLNLAHVYNYIYAYFAKPQAAAELTFIGLSGVLLAYRFEKTHRKEFRNNQLTTLKLPVYEFLLSQMYVTQGDLDKRIQKIFNEYNSVLQKQRIELRKQYPRRSYQMAWARYQGIDPLNPRISTSKNEDSGASIEDSIRRLEDVKLIFRASGRLSGLLSDYVDEYGYTTVVLEKLEEAFAKENGSGNTNGVRENTSDDKLLLTDYVRLVTWSAMSTHSRFYELRVQIFSEIARVFPNESRSDIKQNRNLEKAFAKQRSSIPDTFKVLSGYGFSVAPRRTETTIASSKRFERTKNLFKRVAIKIKRSYK